VTARDRLARAIHQAGYDQHTLLAIATATLPRYRAGELLDDRQLGMVIDAVEVLAQAGASGQQLQQIVARFQAAGPDWRDGFWTQVVQLASARYNRPDLYGLSPCETDPERLHRYGGAHAQLAQALATAPAGQLPAAA